MVVRLVILVFIVLKMSSLHGQLITTEPRNIRLLQRPTLLPQKIGKIKSDLIRESSGLVKSRKHPNVYWTHNDSGGSPKIYPITIDGKLISLNNGNTNRGILIQGAVNRDWEDIAIDNLGNILVGDFGNSSSNRRDLAIYIFQEPDSLTVENINYSQKISFYYSDQEKFPATKNNFDCEAMFTAHENIYLLTKHRDDKDTKLYRLDYTDSKQSQPAILLDSFRIRGKVTAADSTLDGSKIAVLTYNSVWVFEAPAGTDNYFRGKIYWQPIRALQCEAICFNDSETLLITNEQRKILKINIPNMTLLE